MEFIYEVDPKDKRLHKSEPVAFSDLNIKERRDMERWIMKNPDVLGEPLLIITSEFSRFDKSSKRLDLLALDKEGALVVVELKLDTRGTLAELQAIRYAAFCSTVTGPQLADMLAEFERISQEEARKRIESFLDDGAELLRKPPRIILAAGSFDDQEITASVLWLRNFGLDISCVELTLHRLRDETVVMAPRVIIPLPEARDYQIMVEQKKADEAQSGLRSAYATLWQRIAEEFNRLDVNPGGRQFIAKPGAWNTYFKVLAGHSRVHYEWVIRKRLRQLSACVHFEFPELDQNLQLLKLLQDREQEISHGVEWPFEAAPWGDAWAAAQFSVPYSCDPGDFSVAPDAAKTMKILIERTWPLLQPVLNR